MNREQAVQSIMPEQCPECGGTTFTSEDWLLVMDADYATSIRCDNCQKVVGVAKWFKAQPLLPEIIP